MNNLAIYGNIRKKYLPMPAYKRGAVKIDKQFFEFGQHEGLIQQITGYEDVNGWLCFQSQALMISKEYNLADEVEKSGRLLTGELMTGKKSVHIRQIPTGWLLIEMDDKESIDDNHLFYDTRYLSTESNKLRNEKYLDYRIYVQCDDTSAYQAQTCRFMGFSKGEKQCQI